MMKEYFTDLEAGIAEGDPRRKFEPQKALYP